MKEIWLHLDKWEKELVTEAIETGVDAVLTTKDLAARVRELGRIMVVCPETGDKKVPDDVEVIIINNKEDETRAARSLGSKTVIVRTTDWDIIPLENLIPQGGQRLFTFVRNLEDAKLAAGIMEKGVAGVVLETSSREEISRVVKFIKNLERESFGLSVFTVTQVKNIGLGDRVCVDTCSNLELGEGLFVGNSSQALFLVHAENIENPYVSPRPFRVNAGAVHSYVRVPGDRTRYLGELKTGDPVLIINGRGDSYTAHVGRSKIEKRPLLVLFAEDPEGNEHSVVLQNAETIRLMDVDGKPASVVKLKKGDKVLGFSEKIGRHFGMAVEETIKEQ